MTTVLGGKAIAWASVRVRDKDVAVGSDDYMGLSVYVNPHASMDTARQILPLAINDAVNHMDIDKSLASLDAVRKSVRAAYQR